MSQEVVLGALYRDRISKFEGICTGRYSYLTGCTRMTITARDLNADGKVVDLTIDAPQAEFVEMPPDMDELRQTQKARVAADPSAAG